MNKNKIYLVQLLRKLWKFLSPCFLEVNPTVKHSISQHQNILQCYIKITAPKQTSVLHQNLFALTLRLCSMPAKLLTGFAFYLVKITSWKKVMHGQDQNVQTY